MRKFEITTEKSDKQESGISQARIKEIGWRILDLSQKAEGAIVEDLIGLAVELIEAGGQDADMLAEFNRNRANKTPCS